ncbi:MAG: hypothetical protein HY313_01635 [Acidobacteria bacterium]|nr:hypothetical protein [Acidobacteriota bacterium]
MEAKLEALEERLELLSRFTETLEEQFYSETTRWKRWEKSLNETAVAIGRQLSRLREVNRPPE